MATKKKLGVKRARRKVAAKRRKFGGGGGGGAALGAAARGMAKGIGREVAAKAIAATPAAKRKAANLDVDALSPRDLLRSESRFNQALVALTDGGLPTAQRLTLLQKLQSAAFSAIYQGKFRDTYIPALRRLMNDPDPELRQRVLGILSRLNDAVVQKRLLDGLKRPDQALVAPEKAMQLLSYNAHAEPAAYDAAKAIVANPPTPVAKREALRLLSADTNSVPLFEKILRDKNEPADLRQVSAAGLQALNPEKLKTNVREILMDESEDDEIQSTCLTALTHLGDSKVVAQDRRLIDRVGELRNSSKSSVNRSARQFLRKYE